MSKLISLASLILTIALAYQYSRIQELTQEIQEIDRWQRNRYTARLALSTKRALLIAEDPETKECPHVLSAIHSQLRFDLPYLEANLETAAPETSDSILSIMDRAKKLTPPRVADREIDITTRASKAIFASMRILPVYRDGTMAGLTVSGIVNGSFPDALGLEDGDVILDLNGEAIENPRQSDRFLEALSHADEFSLSIERGKTVISLRYPPHREGA